MPGLRLETGVGLETTVSRVIEMRPQHVSVYLLETDKPHTLSLLRESAPSLFPDTDGMARQYLAVGRRLVAAGYRHYELSNFALPGFSARHNMRYWTRRPVLAVGPATHGHARTRRWANVDDLDAYVAAIEDGRLPLAWSRRIEPDEVVRKAVMLGARTSRGVSGVTTRLMRELAPAFAVRLDEVLAVELARLTPAGGFRLSARGWLLSNELLSTVW